MSIITVENINKIYTLGKTEIHALKNVSFSIEKGDFLSVVGPSGCGKTTLLNIIGCIDKPTSGEVYFDGTDVSTLNDSQEADIRLHKIGFIFQTFNLIPVLNIYENIEFPLILSKVPKSKRKGLIEPLIESVGLNEFVKHKPEELSGGQRQRVAIARALVNGPELVIADEPTANLDSETGSGILKIMNKLNRDNNVTFVFSSHDPRVTKHARKLVQLEDGMINEIKEQRALANDVI
jgi:putative ABC transport system ATP-binding protein